MLLAMLITGAALLAAILAVIVALAFRRRSADEDVDGSMGCILPIALFLIGGVGVGLIAGAITGNPATALDWFPFGSN